MVWLDCGACTGQQRRLPTTTGSPSAVLGCSKLVHLLNQSNKQKEILGKKANNTQGRRK
jgi:hypothetical protein